MGVDCKQALCGGDFRSSSHENMSRNANDTLLLTDAGTGRHCRNRLFGYVRANNGEIAVGHFQYLRAMIATLTQVDSISAESFRKHARKLLL